MMPIVMPMRMMKVNLTKAFPRVASRRAIATIFGGLKHTTIHCSNRIANFSDVRSEQVLALVRVQSNDELIR